MARDFPGTNGNYLSMGDVAALDITGTALTLCCWVRPDVVTGNRWTINKDDATQSTAQYRLTISSSKVECAIYDTAVDTVSGATNVTASVWSHIAGRKNGTGAGALQVFLNGVSDGSATSNRSITNKAAAAMIGNRNDNDVPFDGLIAEVGVWNLALSDGEIAALAKGISPLFIRPQNLQGYYPLYGSGSPERDYSGKANSATMTGTVSTGASNPPVMPFLFPIRIGEFTPQNNIYETADNVGTATQTLTEDFSLFTKVITPTITFTKVKRASLSRIQKGGLSPVIETIDNVNVGTQTLIEKTINTLSHSQVNTPSIKLDVLVPPVINGYAVVGSILTVTPGNWSDASSFTYQWYRCDINAENCVEIGGATDTTYTVDAADEGYRLKVRETEDA